MTTFVLDLSRVTITTPATALNTLDAQPPQQLWNPKCRCKQCTGQGLGWIAHVQPKKGQKSRQASSQEMDRFSFDPVTGEVLPRTYTTQPYGPAPYDYPEATQAVKPATSRQWYHPDLDPAPDVAEIKVGALPDNVVDLNTQRNKRGPKAKVKANPLARLLQVAHAERRGWVDDHVYGACYTVAGVSDGKLNVNPKHVLKACLLEEISVGVVKRVMHLDGLRTMSDRTARIVCQCARFATSAMELYLERSPTVRQELQYEVDFANSYYEDQADLVTPEPTIYDYPEEIIALYNAGDYLAYGEALSDYRQGKSRV